MKGEEEQKEELSGGEKNQNAGQRKLQNLAEKIIAQNKTAAKIKIKGKMR